MAWARKCGPRDVLPLLLLRARVGAARDAVGLHLWGAHMEVHRKWQRGQGSSVSGGRQRRYCHAEMWSCEGRNKTTPTLVNPRARIVFGPRVPAIPRHPAAPTVGVARLGLRTGNRRAVLLVSWSAPLVFMQNPVQARMSSCTAAGRGRKRRAAATDDALAEKVPPACRTRTPPSDEQPSNLATATATATTSEHAAGEIYTTPPPQNAPGMRRSLLFTCIPTTITHRLLRTQDLATRTAQNIWSQAVPLHRT